MTRRAAPLDRAPVDRGARFHRLFVALWPDPDVQRRLGVLARQLADRCGGRAVAPANIHLTLAFLGRLDSGAVAEVLHRLGDTHDSAFRLQVDTIGHFAGGIVWAGPAHLPAALGRLAEKVRECARTVSIGFDERPFAAHVTLVRRAVRRVPEAPIPALDWGVGSFRLVRSELASTGPVYSPMGEWDLDGTPRSGSGSAGAADPRETD